MTRTTLMALTVLAGVAACSRPAEPQEAQEEQEEQVLLVFAAASLREPFTALAHDFQQAHPGVTITFNFAGTQELRAQLEQGAAADVLASADTTSMDALVRAGRVQAPALFASNEPVVVVSRQAAATITDFAALPRAAKLVVGGPEVPIGRYTAQILERADKKLGAGYGARVLEHVVSREPNVKQVLAKVRLGEADAGVVYRTDALGVAEVTVVAIPADVNVVVAYPIALTKVPPHPAMARAFVELVRSAAGQAALARAGFLPPAGG